MLAGSCGGNRDHTIAIVIADRRYRLKILEEGEVAMFDDEGTYVRIKRDKTVEVNAPAGLVVLGDLVVSGTVTDHRGTLDSVRDTYNVHTHADPQGGTTSPPAPPIP